MFGRNALKLYPVPEDVLSKHLSKDAVARERTSSQFCYQEFGQKVDPSLNGGVALVVTVGGSGITDAKVASDTWSSSAGKPVNRCLDERAESAWKLAAGAVPAGKYVVRMTFTGR